MKIKQLQLSIIFIIFFLSTAHTATYYIDPANGNINNDGSFDAPWSTLQEVLDNNMVESYENTSHPFDLAINQLVIKNESAPISAGDTLILRGGLHGEVFLQNYNNTNHITILAQSGHVPILKSIKLQGCKFWKFEGVTISSEPYGEYIQSNLVFLESHSWQGPTARIEINNCTVYSTETPWTTAADWVSKVSNGIFIKGDSMDVINNRLMNIDMGITASGDFINAIGNEIINFSGDGMRMLGSNIVFERNLIKNCYAVDDNHDDGIQSFTTIENPFENNIIRSNIILNFDNPGQPLLGALQGIGCFEYVVPVASEELLVKKLDVTIFPNPVINKFQLTIQDAPSIYDLEIFDVTGLVLLKTVLSGYSKTIDISTLNSGTYFVKIINRANHSFGVEKVIKTQ